MSELNFPKRLKIDVLAKDIKAGDPCNEYACPITLAATRALQKRGAPAASVSIQPKVARTRSGFMVVYQRTVKADRFVEAFDRGDKVKPLSFVAVLVK